MKRLLPLLALFPLSGCVPITANGTRGHSSVCEVHHSTMATQRVRTGAVTKEQFDPDYPHAGYPWGKYCVPPVPLWERVYVCQECEKGYKGKHGHDVSRL